MLETNWAVRYTEQAARDAIKTIANLIECALDVIHHRQDEPSPAETLERIQSLLFATHHLALSLIDTYHDDGENA